MRGWKPPDVIALVVILSVVLLKCLGYDSVVSWSLLGVVAGYFGLDLKPWRYIARYRTKKEDDEE